MADPQKLKLYLDSLPTSTRVRAAVWDAFNEPDDARIKARLDALPLDQATKASIWDAAAAPAEPAQPVDPWAEEATPEAEAPFQPFVPPWFNPDLYVGIAKSLGRSAVGAGQLVAQVPGVAPTINAGYDALGFSGVDTKQALADALLQPELTYQGGTQEAGGLVGDVAQFALPGPTGKMTLPARLGREAVTGGLVTALQGGSPTEVGISAGIGAGSQALSPVIAKVPGMLRRKALERTQQFLGGTKERYKEMGARIAPSVLRRNLGWPLGASRETMLATASSRVSQLGRAVQDMISASGGTTVKGKPIWDRLEHLKEAYRTPRVVTATELAANPALQREAFQLPTGEFAVYTIFDKRPIRQLEKLQKVIVELGEDIPLEKIIPLRRAWDDVVDQAGGYAQRAKGGIGVPLKESSEAWAKREGSAAIRKIIESDAPDLAKLNKEFAFWKKLEDVLTQTQKRTAPQNNRLGKTIMSAAGITGGLVAGGDMADKAEKAIFYGTIGGGLQAALTSPRYRLVGAHLRVRLADAIASGDAQRVATALGRVINAMGVPLRQGESVSR